MRRIHVGNALSAFGLGFTVPYLYVDVAQVRGLGPMTAGLVLAVFAVAALIVLPFAGRAIVRRGPLPVLLTALVTAAVGALSLGLSSGEATVLLSAGLLGAGQAVMQPALATMIVDCSTSGTRSRAFATQFFLQNLGLGVGGLIGGHLVDPDRAGSFTLLFSLEAAMFLLLVAVMATVRMPQAPRLDGAVAPSAKGSWKQLMGNRAMVQLCVLGFVLFFACYGQFESGLSAYGVEAAGISTSALGTALAANTLVIVIAQFEAQHRELRAHDHEGVRLRRRGGRHLDVRAGHGAGGEHPRDRDRAVRGAALRGAAQAVPGDRVRRADLGRGVGRGRVRGTRQRQPGHGDGRLHLDVRPV